MKLNVSMPGGPAEVTVQKLVDHAGIKFFLHECPCDSWLYRATEYTSGQAIPSTTFHTIAEAERAACAQIDFYGPTKFQEIVKSLPVLNS